MRTSRYILVVVSVLLLTSEGTFAQPRPHRQSAPQDAKAPETPQVPSGAQLPKFDLKFSDAKPIPGVEGSPIIVMPMQCSPDGVAFTETMLAPTFREMRVSSLEEKGGRSFSLKSIPDLYEVTLLSFYPASSEVAFLVYATKDPKESQYTMGTEKGPVSGKARLGEHHDFIALFDRNGAYKSLIDLPPELEYRKIAEFDSGNFLLLAYSPVNRVASLQVMNSSGQLIRTVEIPAGMSDSPALKQGETGGDVMAMRASGSLSLWQFASARQKIVLYQPHSSAPLLELGSGGEVREVPLATPAGYELDGFVPSDDKWIVRFRRTGLSDTQVSDASTLSGNFQLDEVNPLDGSLMTNLAMEAGSVFSIACEADGNLTSISVGKDSEFLRSSAPIPK